MLVTFFVIHTFFHDFGSKFNSPQSGHHLNVPLSLCWSQWCKSQLHILFIAKLPIACNSKVWSNSYSVYPPSNEIPCIYAWDMKLNCVIVISMKELWNDAFQEFWCWSYSARVYKIPWRAQTGHLRHPLAPRLQKERREEKRGEEGGGMKGEEGGGWGERREGEEGRGCL